MSETPPENPFEELDDGDQEPIDGTRYFEEMSREASDLDIETVWEAVVEDDSDAPARDHSPGDEQPEVVVPKSNYCKKCEHFSEPPNVACRNQGTEIVELVGVDSFRLRNCPVAASRQRAETVFPDES